MLDCGGISTPAPNVTSGEVGNGKGKLMAIGTAAGTINVSGVGSNDGKMVSGILKPEMLGVVTSSEAMPGFAFGSMATSVSTALGPISSMDCSHDRIHKGVLRLRRNNF